MADPVGFGRRLRELREEKGLTQDKLARLVPIPSRYIQRWEAEGVVPSFSRVQELAAALECTVADFDVPPDYVPAKPSTSARPPKKPARRRKGGK